MSKSLEVVNFFTKGEVVLAKKLRGWSKEDERPVVYAGKRDSRTSFVLAFSSSMYYKDGLTVRERDRSNILIKGSNKEKLGLKRDICYLQVPVQVVDNSNIRKAIGKNVEECKEVWELLEKQCKTVNCREFSRY